MHRGGGHKDCAGSAAVQERGWGQRALGVLAMPGMVLPPTASAPPRPTPRPQVQRERELEELQHCSFRPIVGRGPEHNHPLQGLPVEHRLHRAHADR